MKKEQVGDLVLTSDYWDCECEDNFIHPKSQKSCSRCGALAEDQPDSRANEVSDWIRKNKLGVPKK